MNQSLIKKYNVAGPRYTSYPPVPSWNGDFSQPVDWVNHLKIRNNSADAQQGISLYIHLPFCESLCTYCGCTKRITVNHNVEEPYINAVLKEWRMYRSTFKSSPVISELHLGGGTPTFFRPENLKRLISGILKDSKVAKNRQFAFEGHPNNTTHAHMKVLHDLGFRRMSLGIQDFDPTVQKVINRRQTFAQVEKVVAQAREIGFNSINFDLIYGLPLQTRDSIGMTIGLVSKLKPDRIALYSYAHVPWANPAQKMFTPDMLPDNTEKRALYDLAKDMLHKIGFEEIGMDHFALPTDELFLALAETRLHRNFMGYTSSQSKITIGLGVSAISDTFAAYAQNVKKVEQYYSLLDQGKLPVIKGHYLTNEERVARKHIAELMCNLQTSWTPDRSDYCITVANKLREMEADHIIEVSNQQISITATGMPFVRNVAMAFDMHLWERTSVDQPVYSKVI